MGNLSITLDNGIKKIDIYDTDGELITVLKINMEDGNTAERFARLVKRLEQISKEAKEKLEEAKDILDKTDLESCISASRINVGLLNQMIEEIDATFGKNTIRNVFKDAYEINEDFIPDAEALDSFIQSIVPAMEELFERKFKANKEKYSVRRRGKK